LRVCVRIDLPNIFQFRMPFTTPNSKLICSPAQAALAA
jgi:hypothetical protein